jgi:hypothetical protein
MMHSQELVNERYEPFLDKQAPSLTLLENPEEDFQMYRIADLNVAIRGTQFTSQGANYITNKKSRPDIVIDVTDSLIRQKIKDVPFLTRKEALYISTSSYFNVFAAEESVFIYVF